jgi:Fe-S-cluster-containing dehydrogenase component/DMSO reductase anchor subunit
VERFSQLHESNDLPAQAKYYAALMPASAPKPGQQYAFEVNLDGCSGCKACVTACHTLNGLDGDETWRDVGLLHGGDSDLPVLQHVTAACHHCLDPACLNVCPVKAYEKEPATGIVRHLDDQCIGCQYCMLACPYDVPKYNRRLGIVRKCDMCSERLDVGEAPACVQACPNRAIRITVVGQHEVIENCQTGQFLHGGPDPTFTLPTTNYTTRRVLPRNMVPADYYTVRPEHAHLPLVFMLVLTQLSVGAFLVGLVLDYCAGQSPAATVRPLHSAAALIFAMTALGASVLHLGRPLYAFRALIGLCNSWLSREILAFGIFAVLATAYSVAVWQPSLRLTDSPGGTQPAVRALGTGVIVAGLCGVGCSVMIYQCTQRSFWNGSATALKFLFTTLILGSAATVLTSAAAGWLERLTLRDSLANGGFGLLRLLVALAGTKLLFEFAFLRHLRDRRNTLAKRSAILLTGPLARASLCRFGLGFLGGVLLPGLALLDSSAASSNQVVMGFVFVASFAACLAGELLERYLFFTAVVAPRMPGRLTT